MTDTATTAHEAFALSEPHRQIRGEARQLAERFAARHREVRNSGTSESELHPELGGRSRSEAGRDC